MDAACSILTIASEGREQDIPDLLQPLTEGLVERHSGSSGSGLKQKQDATIQLGHAQRHSIGVACTRGRRHSPDQMRRLGNTTPQTTQQLVSSTKKRIAMTVPILHIIPVLCDDQDFARVMATKRAISRFGNDPTTEAYIHFKRVRKQKPRIRAQRTSKVAKLGPKIGSCRKPNGRNRYCLCSINK